jgi:hypothetical protein
MNWTTITTLVGAACAAALAWALDGRESLGVVLGYLAGASTSGACIALQRGAARHRPGLVFHAVLGGFLLKAFAMLVLTLTLHYVPAFSAHADSKAFLFAYAATAMLILFPATIDTLRLLAPGSRRTEEPRAFDALPLSSVKEGRAS